MLPKPRFQLYCTGKLCHNPGGYQNNQSFGANRCRVPKKQQKTKFWSLELPNYPMLQNFGFFGFFGTLQRFGTKTLVFLGPLQGFGSILEQNLTKTLEGTKKTKVLVPKRWRVPKKNFRVLSCHQTTQCSKTLVFLAFLVPSSVLAPKPWFFWDPSRLWEHFGAKPYQNPGGYQKNQSFGAKTLEGTKKKFSSLELPPNYPMLQNFGFLVFLVPSSVLAPKLWCFGTPSRLWEHFGAKPYQNPGGYQKNQSFGAKTLEGTKKNFRVLSCHQTTQCSKTLGFGFFWYLPAFWHQNFGVLGPPMVLARLCSKMLSNTDRCYYYSYQPIW